MARSRTNEIQVGITVLVAVLILVFGMAWLRDFSVTRGKQIWRVAFPEIGGLQAGDEVWVNGIRKGVVQAMALDGDRVVVDLSIAKDIQITDESTIAVRNIGLMGEKMIAVDYRATGSVFDPDEIIPGVYERGLGELMGQIGDTVDGLARLSVHLGTIAEAMADNGQLTRTIRNFDQTSEELRVAVSENRNTLRTAIENLAAASETAKSLTTDREDQLRNSLDNFASAANKLDGLTTRLDSLRAVIFNMTAKVDRGEGTLGKLVNDDQLYADLNESISSLKALIEDIKAHPKRYLKLSIF